jgi:hypothetical protein
MAIIYNYRNSTQKLSSVARIYKNIKSKIKMAVWSSVIDH